MPGDLDDIVHRCLEKDPARRFQSTAELAQRLAKYAQSETQAAISVQRTRSIVDMTTSAGASEPGTVPDALPSTISALLGARTTSQHGGQRWPIAVAMGALIGLVAIALVGVPWLAPEPGHSAPAPAVPHPVPRPPMAPSLAPAPPADPPPAAPPLSAAATPSQPPAATAPPSARAAKPAATKPAATKTRKAHEAPGYARHARREAGDTSRQAAVTAR